MATLTITDVANDLDVVPYTVKRWIKAGKLKAEKESNRNGYRVRYEDYAEFLERFPEYRTRNKTLAEVGMRTKICENLMIGMFQLQKKFLLEEHGKVYSEGWNDAMEAFDKLVKENIVDLC